MKKTRRRLSSVSRRKKGSFSQELFSAFSETLIKELVRYEARVVRLALVLLTIILFTKLFSLSGSIGGSVNFAGLRDFLVPTLIGISSLVILLTIIAFVILISRKQVADASRLKYDVTRAFTLALDKSSFNPHLIKEGAHEQSGPKAAE
jgi:hypothetical protein